MKRPNPGLGVEKPARYLGGEFGQIVKERASLRLALLFPDVYEVAESYIGLKILYKVANDMPNVAAERVYAPWPDMKGYLDARGFRLGSLETGRPLSDFDVIGVTLQYEASYTTFLQMLRMGGVAWEWKDRRPGEPVVVAGGPCAFNPEPLAPFLDAVLLGDGERALPELLDLLERIGAPAGVSRRDLHEAMAALKGVYVPSLYEEKDESIVPIMGSTAPVSVEKRIESDLDELPFPDVQILPNVKTVHDRIAVEIQRGCTRGCRFCHAGMVYRPSRQRSRAKIVELARKAVQATGHEEIGLLSLSAGDHPCIGDVVRDLIESAGLPVGISLPSMRVETLGSGLARAIASARKTGFTIAPEAGSERLRRVINKDHDRDEVLRTVDAVARAGWKRLKMYFMVGLPSEEEKDVDAIVDLVRDCAVRARKVGGMVLHMSVAAMVPKSHTPFQWEPMLSLEQSFQRLKHLAGCLRERRVTVRWHDPRQGLVEAALARGGRRTSEALRNAVESGCYLDSWSENFDFDKWMEAFARAGLDLEQEAQSAKDLHAPLPWDHLSAGVTKDFLLSERSAAFAGEMTDDCAITGRCTGCGVCDFEEVMPVRASDCATHELFEPAESAMDQEIDRMKLVLELDVSEPASSLSHLDFRTMLVRAMRRAGWNLAYSKGFHPHPRLTFEWAKPLGMESRSELVEVQVLGVTEPASLAESLQSNLPEGVTILSLRKKPLNSPSCASLLESILVEADLAGTSAANRLGELLERFHMRDSIEVVRRPIGGRNGGRPRKLDLKKGLRRIEPLSDTRIRMEFVVAPSGTPRLSEVLSNVLELTDEEINSIQAVKIRSVRRDLGLDGARGKEGG